MVFEHVDGQSLYARLSKGRLPSPLALYIPEDRFQNATALIEAIDTLVKTEKLEYAPIAPPAPTDRAITTGRPEVPEPLPKVLDVVAAQLPEKNRGISPRLLGLVVCAGLALLIPLLIWLFGFPRG